MSNRIYEDKMYNEEIKGKFISEYGRGTQKIISRIFKISNAIENDLKKDLFSFSREELRRLMFLFMPTTENSSRHNVSWVSKYIDWAIDNGHKNGLNPLDTVDKGWHKQFVNNNIKKYWTTDEISNIIDSRKNAQDAVIISLIFNGVGGEGHAELLNLTKNDVDAFNNKLHLLTDESKRTIEVDEQCIKLCKDALTEDIYEKMNGNTSPDIRAEHANLIENDFVVRSANTNTEHFHEAEKNIVYRRLSKIANEINEPYFTPRNIAYSGMLAMAKELYLLSGKLEKKEYKLIAEQFNFNMEQSLTRIKNEFLNLNTLRSIYPNI